MSVTCIVHHGEVDASDTVDLPDGKVCTRCYGWMESLLDDESDDDGTLTIVYTFDDDDEDDDDDSE